MQKVFFNGWGSKEHLWQKQNWIFHIIPEDKAPQPDSPGTSISCSASHTSLPVSGELQSYNMFCQGYIKKSELFTCILFSWPLELLTRWQKWTVFPVKSGKWHTRTEHHHACSVHVQYGSLLQSPKLLTSHFYVLWRHYSRLGSRGLYYFRKFSSL